MYVLWRKKESKEIEKNGTGGGTDILTEMISKNITNRHPNRGFKKETRKTVKLQRYYLTWKNWSINIWYDLSINQTFYNPGFHWLISSLPWSFLSSHLFSCDNYDQIMMCKFLSGILITLPNFRLLCSASWELAWQSVPETHVIHLIEVEIDYFQDLSRIPLLTK